MCKNTIMLFDHKRIYLSNSRYFLGALNLHLSSMQLPHSWHRPYLTKLVQVYSIRADNV